MIGGNAVIALPFDGDLFGVAVFNPLSTPASTNSTVAPVLGFIEPQSSTIPEPESVITIGIGLACLIGFWFFARRLNPSK